MEKGDRRAVIAAFLANLGIAAAKLVGFLLTGAASMAAEAVHSLADTGNEALLLLGQFRGGREPDAQHPFGFGRERYFWSFVVALVLFSAGGVFALVEAEEKLRRPHELTSPAVAVGILLVAVVFEGLSLRTAVGQARPEKGCRSWWRFVRESKRAELPVVLLEDSGALVGLALALVGVVLAAVTGNDRFDAVGSLGIGVLLVVIAATLAMEMKSLLVGEAASGADVTAIRAALESDEGVDEVLDLRTLQLGPDDELVVSRFRPTDPATAVETVARMEEAIRRAAPSALTYLEPEVAGDEAAPPAEQDPG